MGHAGYLVAHPSLVAYAISVGYILQDGDYPELHAVYFLPLSLSVKQVQMNSVF